MYQIVSNRDHHQTLKLLKIRRRERRKPLEAYANLERLKLPILKQTLDSVLHEMSWDTELIENLLSSYPGRMIALKAVNGSNTDY